ncbi:AraC family transcriptional regulator [Ktedonospora formicarum]|uniref:AraC family transcriptional regulator n=1 Tax=Ktedonospora formicarum TaxID=2778364 RepID=A0A8J3IH45_9CHLR|nr:AraC family transcriptional regulator [Ktedonospora formicarum]GHO51039.1 AraC family transcriptional regulator [Ktedonospora formicarum]
MQYPDTFLWTELAVSQEATPCYFTKMRGHQSLPLLLRHERYNHGIDTGPHHHLDFYAFYIVQNGQGIHLIDHHPYTIVRGDVYILPPGVVHAYQRYHMLELDAFYFQRHLFSTEELAALRALPIFWHLLIGTEDTSMGKESCYAHRLHLSPEHHHAVNTMLAEICMEYAEQDLAAVQLTRCQLFRLLVSITRRQGAVDKKPPLSELNGKAPYSPDIVHILRMCEERFHEPLTVPQLASLLFLSPSRFSEIFTREVGVPPATYIRRLRLECAQTLLRTTSLSVTEIAHRVGFNDGPRLTRTFQAVFHLTPTAYRTNFGS